MTNKIIISGSNIRKWHTFWVIYLMLFLYILIDFNYTLFAKQLFYDNTIGDFLLKIMGHSNNFVFGDQLFEVFLKCNVILIIVSGLIWIVLFNIFLALLSLIDRNKSEN